MSTCAPTGKAPTVSPSHSVVEPAAPLTAARAVLISVAPEITVAPAAATHVPPAHATPGGQSASTKHSPQVCRTGSQRLGREPASPPPIGAQSRSSR